MGKPSEANRKMITFLKKNLIRQHFDYKLNVLVPVLIISLVPFLVCSNAAEFSIFSP